MGFYAANILVVALVGWVDQPVHEGAVAGAHPGDPLAQGAAVWAPSCARPGSRSTPSSSSPGPCSSAAASS
ncbi:MAG: hypothetical protein M0C28_02790 [Candidatus Moduliflexus flocculans]|nr:hypothetical protein [Candidatus Moduliflexus flocculans]